MWGGHWLSCSPHPHPSWRFFTLSTERAEDQQGCLNLHNTLCLLMRGCLSQQPYWGDGVGWMDAQAPLPRRVGCLPRSTMGKGCNHVSSLPITAGQNDHILQARCANHPHHCHLETGLQREQDFPACTHPLVFLPPLPPAPKSTRAASHASQPSCLI